MNDDWMSDAPCTGSWSLFDVPSDLRGRAAAEWAADALDICAGCRFVTACLKRVDPRHSQFDGVAGGILWRNGRPARVQKVKKMGGPVTAPCGTRSAYERHLRRGEKPCMPCKVAKATYKAQYEARIRQRAQQREDDMLAAALTTVLSAVADDLERIADHLPLAPLALDFDPDLLGIADALTSRCGCGAWIFDAATCAPCARAALQEAS